MAYEDMKTGARMALLCLEPGRAHSPEEVRRNVFEAYRKDDRRMGFHLAHLHFIGLAEPQVLSNNKVGYEITELGIRAANQMAH